MERKSNTKADEWYPLGTINHEEGNKTSLSKLIGSIGEVEKIPRLIEEKPKKHLHIADVNTNKVYLSLLKDYGQFTYICVHPQAVEAVKKQWREVEELGEISINGTKAVQLLCYYGSSTYTTAEFSRLLDGTMEEMRQIGLTPPADEQIERSLKEWERRHEQ